jgi:hypothetical protein
MLAAPTWGEAGAGLGMGGRMTKEDIIAMARRAGAHDDGNEVRFVELRYLERFAALVAAAEREACAKVCETFYNHEAKDCAEAIRSRGQE